MKALTYNKDTRNNFNDDLKAMTRLNTILEEMFYIRIAFKKSHRETFIIGTANIKETYIFDNTLKVEFENDKMYVDINTYDEIDFDIINDETGEILSTLIYNLK